jgi:hypothetical protein
MDANIEYELSLYENYKNGKPIFSNDVKKLNKFTKGKNI